MANIVDIDDLTQLKHLHEDTMLDCIASRFAAGRIYTITGPVLLAVNPFQAVPGLYSTRTVRSYQTGARTPHIFAIAQSAYAGMTDAVSDFRGTKVANQSILISGESGAGKTETAKLVMKNLSLCGHADTMTSQSTIERQILESNPLLEAFGNARTLRNDNSSRFGKFIQLHFSRPSPSSGLKVIGAKIETYLLEKIRVCAQSEGERSFHIFYQCCAAAASVGGVVYQFPQLIKSEDKFRLKLNGFADHSVFSYLTGNTSCYSSPSINDVAEFESTIQAMRVIGMSVRDIEELLATVASVLHLGNITFSQTDGGESCSVSESSKEALYMACALLGIHDPDALETALTTKAISVSSVEGSHTENYRTLLPAAKAADVRDAFARSIYSAVFSYLVRLTNRTIDADDVSMTDGPSGVVSCGLLDIFGFEYFTCNTFEQLCINYANERLQHLFVECVLKAEQQLYESESIAWDRLEFPDNTGIISLLHHPTTGILPMLDEECKIVGGNDSNFLSKMTKANSANPLYSTVRSKQDWFIISHFAGHVAYKVTTGFVDKNRDALSSDVVEMAKQSEILAKLGGMHEGRHQQIVASGPRMRAKTYTVSSEFREQLNKLMETITLTHSFFIRCIKPNSKNVPVQFDRPIVAEQLRYGGVLQAVQISRAGFPIRIEHQEFLQDFGSLAVGRISKSDRGDVRYRVDSVMQRLDSLYGLVEAGAGNTSSVPYALGRTKIFMKQPVWEILNRARTELLSRAATKIQSFLRMAVAKREYTSLLSALVSVQSVIRTAMVVRGVIRERAATRIQAAFVSFAVRQYYRYVRDCVVKIQRLARAKVIKRRRKRSSMDMKMTHVPKQRASVTGGGVDLFAQMEQLGAELRAAKETMKTVESHPATGGNSRLAYFNSGTANQSYFAPHLSIPPAPFFLSRRGGVSSRFDRENAPPGNTAAAPVVRTASMQKGAGGISPSKIGSIEKRVMKVHDDMTKMKELIDRIQNNMSDL